MGVAVMLRGRSAYPLPFEREPARTLLEVLSKIRELPAGLFFLANPP
jgi:hypothetical protein